MFSRRSTDHTCQPFAMRTTALASGAKYAALAEVPGFRTRMFGAFRGPILRMPTLLYFAGVPGEGKPSSRWNLVAADADVARTHGRSAIVSVRASLRTGRKVSMRGH